MKNSTKIIEGYVTRVEEIIDNIEYVGSNYAYMSRTGGYEDQLKEYRKQKKEKERIYRKAYKIVNPLVAKKKRIEKKISNLEKNSNNTKEINDKIEKLEQKRRELDIRICEAELQLKKLVKLENPRKDYKKDENNDVEQIEEINIVEPESLNINEEKHEVEAESLNINEEKYEVEVENKNINTFEMEDIDRELAMQKVLLEEAEDNMDYEYAEEIRKNIEKIEVRKEQRKIEESILKAKRIEYLKAELEIAEEEMDFEQAEEIRKELKKLQPEQNIAKPEEKLKEVSNPTIEIKKNNIEKKDIKDKVDVVAQTKRNEIKPLKKEIPQTVINSTPLNKKAEQTQEIVDNLNENTITTAPLKGETVKENNKLQPWKKAVINIAGFGILIADKVKSFASFIANKFSIDKESATLLIEGGTEKAIQKFTRTLSEGKETIKQLAEKANEKLEIQKAKIELEICEKRNIVLNKKGKKLENKIKSREAKFREQIRVVDEKRAENQNRKSELREKMITKKANKEEKNENEIGA